MTKSIIKKITPRKFENNLIKEIINIEIINNDYKRIY